MATITLQQMYDQWVGTKEELEAVKAELEAMNAKLAGTLDVKQTGSIETLLEGDSTLNLTAGSTVTLYTNSLNNAIKTVTVSIFAASAVALDLLYQEHWTSSSWVFEKFSFNQVGRYTFNNVSKNFSIQLKNTDVVDRNIQRRKITGYR